MPRARNIKPSFFVNDKLAECKPLARILFIGLWTIADREGRLEDRPKKIKVEILPYDDCDVNILLNELYKGGFINRYKVGNIAYIQVVNFTKHQNCHIKEVASFIPAPDQHQTCTSLESPLTESLLLNPESPLLNPDISSPKNIDRFENFWDVYGYKIGKDKAIIAYSKLIKKGVTHDEIIFGVGNYQRDCQRKGVSGKYIKHPATWLNGGHWKDEYPEFVVEDRRKQEYEEAAVRGMLRAENPDF